MVTYPVLRAELARRGVKISAISKALGITGRTFRNKLNGESAFTWPEVCQINEQFFPDMKKDELFMREAVNNERES